MILTSNMEKELEDFMKSEFDMDAMDLDDDEFGDEHDLLGFQMKEHNEEEILDRLGQHFGPNFIFHTIQIGGILGIFPIPI